MGALFTPDERLNYTDAFIKVDEKPIDLDFWQERFLMDAQRHSIVLKSRRTGFSFITALKGLVKAMDGNRTKYVRQFVSYNEEDAKEKIQYAQEFYASIHPKAKKKLRSCTKTAMEFYDKSGKTVSRLISIACRPPRGRGGDIVFDEMAIYPENKAEVIYTAGIPVTARGGCVEIGSTPLGKIGRFYDVFIDKKKYRTYNRYTIPWWFSAALCTNVEEAVRNAPAMDTEERVYRYGTPPLIEAFEAMLLEDFQQEFECTFIDSALSFITLDLIYANTPGMRAEDRTEEIRGGNIEDADIEDEKDLEIKIFRTSDELCAGYSREEHGVLYLGYDVARYRDAAVIYVLGVVDGKKKCVAEIEMKNKKFEYQRDEIRKIMRQLPVVRGCIDRTGQGLDTTETLQKEFGESKLEGIDFTTPAKEVLAMGVRTGLEKREFLLPNDQKFRKQIHSIKRIPSAGGSFRYDSTRDKDGHADSFWAFALANHAIIGNTAQATTGFYQQVKQRNEAGKKETKKSSSRRTRGKTLAQIDKKIK